MNPWCVASYADGGTSTPVAPIVANGGKACAAGTAPEFSPITDIHIGIVTSSLGDHGASNFGGKGTPPFGPCPLTDPNGGGACTAGGNPTMNDMGHLVDRTSALPGACNPAPVAGMYNNLAFLAWDPNGADKPAGQALEGAISAVAGTAGTGLLGSLQAMVNGVGQIGCGYESQIEGWYRFLIEPEPWTSIAIPNPSSLGNAEFCYPGAPGSCIDYALLQQRAEFLRPDSLVAIIGVTDENDTSLRDGSVYWMANWLQNGNAAVCLPRPARSAPRARTTRAAQAALKTLRQAVPWIRIVPLRQPISCPVPTPAG